ncbi:hypothetical protein L7F22_024117 [Adiantum nelumboides]|nr:hypothetical protein [Adiantum nelumboides]
MKQNDDIKNLALKNQELEHKLQMQDLRVRQQEEKLQELKETLDKQAATVQNTLATHDEKLMNVFENVGSGKDILKSKPMPQTLAPMNGDMYANEDDKEATEQEKRKMNIVIRCIPEPDNEKVLTLNADVTDMISANFGMHDVVVYGAHRVGKKKPETTRAIVCTLLDARKRAIILENARIYLKGLATQLQGRGSLQDYVLEWTGRGRGVALGTKNPRAERSWPRWAAASSKS